MTAKTPSMKMPELLIFAKMFFIGFVVSEAFRLSFYLGAIIAQKYADLGFFIKASCFILVLSICFAYVLKRNALLSVWLIAKSLRFDLLWMLIIGFCLNQLVSPWLEKVHIAFKSADPHLAELFLIFLCLVLLSPLLQHFRTKIDKSPSSPYFIADEEIENTTDDLLANEVQAKSFADTVLACGGHSGLVFGVDGPWGVGKTSFINMAERTWEKSGDKVIVCRFEPLRYASEPDLADRLIRDLSATIQTKVFVPEFRPAVSRYSRLIKGKADISFFGFKLSLEPSQETVDELLEDIDEVLRRIGRKVIIVIDDLDRLDAKTTNNVLFATKRTFKLSQATYVLCYDTEVLADSTEDGVRAREFLEKFVTAKLGLFIDSSSLRDFLRRNWSHSDLQLASVPSDTMIKLGSILNELANLLDGKFAANYMPLVGNLRKVKRFVNAILLMQIEKTNLGRTDFNKQDLINLILLHLNYPGLFRRIYAEETDGRSSIFTLVRENNNQELKNVEGFEQMKNEQEPSARFLLEQLFDVETLQIGILNHIEEQVFRSRACFNKSGYRNLEAYLKLIVRFETPLPQETFVMYQGAIARFLKGESIASVLASANFELSKGENAHDEFWRMLVEQSYDFTSSQANEAIDTLIDYLPRYSSLRDDDRGLRQRSIYTLLRLLDRAGWGKTSGQRLPNTVENVLEIAWRLFGEDTYHGNGLLQRFVSSERGVLGWNDLMLFRLQCSADRGGQLYNLHRALIAHQDKSAPTDGLVSKLALMGMRVLSQQVFALFKRTYIDTQRNFFADVDDLPDCEFLGEANASRIGQVPPESELEGHNNNLYRQVATVRDNVKSFVIYQLSNTNQPNGSGVGCGIYDDVGSKDGKGIAEIMNEYVFGICFNPQIDEKNVFFFLDYCLSNLSSSYFSGSDEDGYIAHKSTLAGGLEPKAMGCYWRLNGEFIRGYVTSENERRVFTSNYIASYSEDLNGVYEVLDELANEYCSTHNTDLT